MKRGPKVAGPGFSEAMSAPSGDNGEKALTAWLYPVVTLARSGLHAHALMRGSGPSIQQASCIGKSDALLRLNSLGLHGARVYDDARTGLPHRRNIDVRWNVPNLDR